MIVLLALAGGLGAVCRFVVDGEIRSRSEGDFPWGVLVVNVVGSSLLGLLTGAVLAGADEAWHLVLGVGFCGGFTTFGTAVVDSVRLVRSHRPGLAVANLVGSLLLTCAAAGLGLWVAHLLVPSLAAAGAVP